LSGLGFINPATISFITQSYQAARGATGGGVFDIFGPTQEFREAQAVRDEYNAMADSLRDNLPSMPESAVKRSMSVYLPITRSVIARGAKASDLAELKAKFAEWAEMSSAAAAAPSFEMAGLPWYVWIIAGGLLLPMFLKKGGR